MYEVSIDEFVLQCEVTYLEDVPPTPGIDTSDWDAYGYRKMELQVISGQVYDEEGVATDAGRNACAALAENMLSSSSRSCGARLKLSDRMSPDLGGCSKATEQSLTRLPHRGAIDELSGLSCRQYHATNMYITYYTIKA